MSFATRSRPANSEVHQPGRLIGGRYKLLNIAGRGGMGVVFKAEDTKLRRTVALKFLPWEIGLDPEAKKRFLREAQAAAILDHPNICPVYEVDESGGEMFLTMAFVEGRSLKERIAEGPIPVEEVFDIAIQISDGLKTAHRKGVVHRDIKPANIMLSREGQVRIMDFGLASLECGADLTRPQTVLGTAPYMSPEQIQGEKADARADIWSFGCTLFEIATGRRPFVGESAQAVRHEILHEDPQSPSLLKPEIPPGLEDIILKCLRKNVVERFPDFDGLQEALEGEKFRRTESAADSRMPRKTVPSVAVLPFVDMSSAHDQDFFGEGLAEELIHALARLQGLRIVARTSAFAFKGMKLDVREIGRKLDVGAILEGSVRKAGNRLRVTVQLIDTRTGLHIWSERFDREERDVFDIQDEISQAIVEHLKVTLLSGEKASLGKRSTADTEAFNLYLKGLYFMARPNPENIQKAMDFFRQALDRDPNFARVHSGMAFLFATRGILNLGPWTEMYPRAKASLEQALALDPDSAEAQAVKATLQFYHDWDWAAAETSFRRAIELNPGDAMTRGQYAQLLCNRRRFEESLTEIKHALTLDPLMPFFYAWSILLHMSAGRCDEALEEFARLRQFEPNFGLAHFHAGTAYFRKGLVDEAVEMFEKARQLVDFPGWNEGMLLFCRLKKGERAEAERILADMLEARKRSPVSPVSLGWGYAALGDFERAFEWIETAIREREPAAAYLNIYTEFLVPDLARDPRFSAVLDRLRLPY
jgi:TolB-like protein/Flp pilus assembly protein TadD/predicted Ser/Thr protein kinase